MQLLRSRVTLSDARGSRRDAGTMARPAVRRLEETRMRRCTCGRRSSARSHSLALPPSITAGVLRSMHLPRGLTTPARCRTAIAPSVVAFDFIDHQLVIETSDSNRRAMPLAPRTVADFYREVMATLRDMALPVTIR